MIEMQLRCPYDPVMQALKLIKRRFDDIAFPILNGLTLDIASMAWSP